MVYTNGLKSKTLFKIEDRKKQRALIEELKKVYLEELKEDNKRAMRKYKKEYYQKNKEKIRQYQKEKYKQKKLCIS